MTSQQNERTVIVVAIDASDHAGQVVTAATQHARALAGSQLHLVHVVPEASVVPEATMGSAVTERLEAARLLVERLAEHAKGHFTGVVSGHVAVGIPWREIVQAATNLEADLLVVGTHDYKGLKRMLLGSVAEHVAKAASCPVLIVRPKQHEAARVPEIEPPCPDCVRTQRDSQGQTLWCDRHRKPHAHGRLHYSYPPSFGRGSMLVRPD